MLTGSGKVAAVAGPLLLALGAATHWPELMALGVGCLLALAASLWWLLRRPDLIATREITPPRVREGERAVADTVGRQRSRSVR